MMQIREAISLALRRYSVHRGVPAEWSRALSDDEWDDLVDRDLVRAFEEGKATPDTLAKTVYTTRRNRLALPRVPRHSPALHRSSNRQRRLATDVALADVFATHCERESAYWPYIQAFRRDVLNNQFVSDVAAWFTAQAQQQGKPTIRRGRARLVAVRCDGVVIHRATRLGKPLDRLRTLSERLSAFYPWHVADAATFVLTGKTPATPSIAADIRLTTPMLARSTITLTVRPTATPDEVAEAYSRVRTEAIGRRVRRLRDRHARLAVFTFREGANATAFDRWNRAHPKWRYKFLSTFRREAALAINWLLELRPHRSSSQLLQ